jgi:hypothetical protein
VSRSITELDAAWRRWGFAALSQDGRGRVAQSVVETKRALFGKGDVTGAKRSDGDTSVRAPRKKDARPLSTVKVGG